MISDNHLDILYNAYACNAHAQQGIHHWRLQTRVLHLKESGLALRHQLNQLRVYPYYLFRFKLITNPMFSKPFI